MQPCLGDYLGLLPRPLKANSSSKVSYYTWLITQGKCNVATTWINPSQEQKRQTEADDNNIGLEAIAVSCPGTGLCIL